MVAQRARIATEVASIMLTAEAGPSLDILERLEIITAEAVLGMNIFQDIGSAMRDLVGGRNQTYQVQLREARKSVLAELKLQAYQLGADAVVAVDPDYSEISGGGKSMLFVVASGTVARLAKGDLADNPAKQLQVSAPFCPAVQHIVTIIYQYLTAYMQMADPTCNAICMFRADNLAQIEPNRPSKPPLIPYFIAV